MNQHCVGLYVDYWSLRERAWAEGTPTVPHARIGEQLLTLAGRYAPDIQPMIWDGWAVLPEARDAFEALGYEARERGSAGEPVSDEGGLSGMLRSSMNAENAPHTLVIASLDEALGPLLDDLRERGHHIVVVGIDAAVPPVLSEVADEIVRLKLDRGRLADAATRERARSTPPMGVPAMKPSSHRGRAGGKGGPPPADLLAQVRSSLVAFMAERRLPWVSYRLFAGYLTSTGVVEAERVHVVIEHAVRSGYLVREQEVGEQKKFYRFTPARSPFSLASGASSGLGAEQGAEKAWTNSKASGRTPGPSSRRDVSPPAGAQGDFWNRDWRNFTFVRIAWALQRVLADKPSHFYINPATLAETLKDEHIGMTTEEVFFWVNQSVDKGVLIRDVRSAGADGSQFYRYYLNQQSRLVYFSREVPAAIVETLDTVLAEHAEWRGIAFSFLIRLLQVHPILANPVHELQPFRLREWLNFLIDEGILCKFEEPDIKDPSRTTTMIAVNPEHRQVRFFRTERAASPFFEPRHQAVIRTVLTIDHFVHWLRTKSPDEDWLPLMTLKSWMRTMMGDQLTKWSISQCEEERFFLIDRYKNKGAGEGTVAGVRLDTSHERVSDLLSKRDAFLRLLARLLRKRAAIPYGMLEQHVRDSVAFGEREDERLGWIPILVDTRVITLERDKSRSGGQAFVCRLNARERFVGELLTRIMREERAS